MTDKNQICLIEGCGRLVRPEGKPVGCRGLCKNCFVAASDAVLKGKVTKEQLVDMGLMLPSKRYVLKNAFALALAKALEDK